MSTTLLRALVRHIQQTVFATALATVLTACGNSERVLGTVELRGQEEKTFSVEVPPNIEAETGWRLRFGILSKEKFDALTASDRVTVYLENDDNKPMEFLKGFDKTKDIYSQWIKVTIAPGEKIELFQGTVSELLMIGRDEYAAMVFAPVKRSVNYKLHFVPHMDQNDTCTIPLLLYYYPATIL